MVDPSAVAVHPANQDQLRSWDGDGGAYWAAHAEHFERSMARYTPLLFAAAGIRRDDRVLDVGCGAGGTTREAARRAPAGEAVGVDLSSAMLAVARGTADRDGVGNVRFVQADAQVHPFPADSFDVAISRAGAMFFGDPVAAFANFGRALVRGGRLALLVWQAAAANEWLSEIAGSLAPGRPLPTPPPDVPSPFSMADPDRVRTILGTAGFGEVDVTAAAEPMSFGRDVDDAVAFIQGLAGWMLDGQDDEARARALGDLRRSAERHLTEDGVEFGSAGWLVTARRPR
jgi:SAM-dependent methyltransferase